MQNRNLIWVLVILVGAAVVLWASRRMQPRTAPAVDPAVEPVADAYRLIRREYYYSQDLHDARMAREAIRGMVHGLDGYSSYVDAETLPGFASHLAGHDHGLGLVLQIEQGRCLVIGPRPDSPAHRAGIYSGEVLVAVDGLDVSPRNMPAIRDRINAPSGTEVAMTLQRPPAPPRDVTLICSQYAGQSVTGLFRDRLGRWQYRLPDTPEVAYLRVTEFVSGSDRAVQEVVRGLDSVQAIVLDLRGNPGGSLPEAVAVADLFLRGGVIMTVAQRDGTRQQYRAHSPGTSDPPLVVLVDENTASAAEIVAGALSAHARAVVVGSRTRGKGCVQTMFPLAGDMGQINLTTAEFLVGEDRSITRLPGSRKWGVQPNIDVSAADGTAGAELARMRLTTTVMPAPTSTTAPAGDTIGDGRVLARRLLMTDPQLARAVQLAREPAEIDAMLQTPTSQPLSAPDHD